MYVCPQTGRKFRPGLFLALLIFMGLTPSCSQSFPDTDELSIALLLYLNASVPGVNSVYPSDGQTSVKVSETPLLVFTREMNDSTITMQTSAGTCSGSVQLSSDDFSSCLAGSITNSGDNITFSLSPTQRLMENTTFKLKLTTGITATSGRNLAAEVTHSTGFTTFNPLSISSNILWLRADSPSGVRNSTSSIASDGEGVLYWLDESGSSNNSLQATGTKQPIFKTNIMDGKPVLRFDGVDDFLEITNALVHAEAEASIFIVVHTTGATLTTADVLFGCEGAGTDTFLVRFGAGGIAAIGLNINGIGTQGSSALTDRSNSTQSFLLTGRAADSSATYPGILLGDNGIFGSANLTAWSGNTINASSPKYIGARRFGGTDDNHFPGDIAEILLFNRALSSTEVSQISCHLSYKYSFTFAGCP